MKGGVCVGMLQSVSVVGVVKEQLDKMVDDLEHRLDADVMAFVGPILHGCEHKIRAAVEMFQNRRDKLSIVLDTGGGVVEIVERMVDILRHHYDEIEFVIPDRAMSAGTVFAMAGDSIRMDYVACLGPIDPQIEKDGRLIPALSYLVQYQRLIQKSAEGKLTAAEFAMLDKLDLAELHQFEEARALSMELLINWLARYKFKNWQVTETRGLEVSDELRASRAREIADNLSDNARWHSHGRGISMKTLRDDLKLKIDDFGQDEDLSHSIRTYHIFLRDYMYRERIEHFVHTRYYF